MTALAVETTNLSKSYGDQPALQRVDLQVPEGSVYVLVGANGAGKSTTFKILLNLERPDSGSASVFGLDTETKGPETRAQIGYVPEQTDAGYRWMTCARLLRHGRTVFLRAAKFLRSTTQLPAMRRVQSESHSTQ